MSRALYRRDERAVWHCVARKPHKSDALLASKVKYDGDEAMANRGIFFLVLKDDFVWDLHFVLSL